MTVHRIFYGDVRRGSVPVAPVNRCPSRSTSKPARTAHEAGSAGSGHDFRGVCFFSRLHYTQRQILSILPENRSIYHNSRCTYPLNALSRFLAQNAKDKKTPRPNQKNAPESFFRWLHNYARKRPAIGFVCSEYRTGQNDTFSLPQWSVLYRDFVPLSIILITGFPS